VAKAPFSKRAASWTVAADEGCGRVAMAFGLENLVVFDGAKLADRAIDRAEKSGVGKRPRTGTQRSGEELVEAPVAGRIGIDGLAQVDAVALNEPADDTGREAAGFTLGELAGDCGQSLFGQKVLGQYGKTVGHDWACGSEGAIIRAEPSAVLHGSPCEWKLELG
jgi:hypothetical protein